MLDLIEKVQRRRADAAPVAKLIGFTLTGIEPGRAVLEMVADARHANRRAPCDEAKGRQAACRRVTPSVTMAYRI